MLHEGADVHILVRPGYSDWRIKDIKAGLPVHEVQLSDAAAVRACVKEVRPEWVFHLAAHGAYSWQTDPSEMLKTNLLGTVNLCEACGELGFDAFVYAGSSSEYGWKDHAPKESEFADPTSIYGASKLAATQYCSYLAREKNLPIRSLRLYSVYGAYEDPKRLLPTLIVRGLSGCLPTLVDPEVARDFTYLEDALDAFISAASVKHVESGQGTNQDCVYNVGTGRQTKIKELVALTRRALGVKEEPHWGSMQNRSWDTTTWVADAERIKADLGWSAKFDLEQGFKAMVDWFRDNPEMLAYYRERC
jgi:dolichol-phosphate mannosyltransferase